MIQVVTERMLMSAAQRIGVLCPTWCINAPPFSRQVNVSHIRYLNAKHKKLHAHSWGDCVTQAVLTSGRVIRTITANPKGIAHVSVMKVSNWNENHASSVNSLLPFICRALSRICGLGAIVETLSC